MTSKLYVLLLNLIEEITSSVFDMSLLCSHEVIIQEMIANEMTVKVNFLLLLIDWLQFDSIKVMLQFLES